jgi:multidrug efflux pump
VFGGMISGTLLAIFFVPVFVFVIGTQARIQAWRAHEHSNDHADRCAGLLALGKQ